MANGGPIVKIWFNAKSFWAGPAHGRTCENMAKLWRRPPAEHFLEFLVCGNGGIHIELALQLKSVMQGVVDELVRRETQFLFRT